MDLPRIGSGLSLTLTLSLIGCKDPGSSLPGPTVESFEEVPAADLAALALTPFDVDREDLGGPGDWDPQYGKLPEIVVAPGEGRLDVALRSFEPEGVTRTFVLRFEDAGAGLELVRALEAPSLGLLLGFVAAPDGGFYYATATDDLDVSEFYPENGQHRANVIRVYRVGPTGEILFDVDLDLMRHEADEAAEPIVNPGVASSARLGLAGDQLALVHGNNTEPDPNIGGARHQKAVTTILDATTGTITAVSSLWCSHSFDQRYLAVGDDLYELHLGDAYPRQIVVTRLRDAVAGAAIGLYGPKGETGANNTFTRLGGIAAIDEGAGAGGFLIAFASERSGEVEALVNGSRDLALVRTLPDFASGDPAMALDPSFGTTFEVVSGGATQTNRVLWLTDHHDTAPGMRHVERPKLLALGGGEFLLLWEQWAYDGAASSFEGTFAMRVDGDGTALAPAAQVATSHLPRGDDAFVYEGEGCWLSGDSVAHTLTLHCVAPNLEATHRELG